ncbi:endo-1,4-beta-xylanase 5-like [Hordeum vulgare subsp. vulgare]|uniref:GH10 domain-containing protein n=1 Tax=Hordeum vulgare subsp. vulgare TaxID=112509 RepID=A0A8I6WYR7_HORVV|nr:endo-1,4-beta-xylanase 5-like [Hordeum vulgare subsp. vulgare]
MGRLLFIFLLFISLFEGWMVQSVPYDHTASIECLSSPMRSLYKGGILQNSEFDSGLMGWLVPPGVKAGVNSSQSGNKFADAKNKGQPSHSVYQKIQMQTNHHYSLSAWLQVSSGTAVVKAIFLAPNGAYIGGGAVVAKSGCWSMLKGGMTAYSSGPAEFFFEADGRVDILVDSVSLQPFTFAEWRNHTSQSADKVRKSAVKVVARGADGVPLANAELSVKLLRPGFPLGNAMTKEILDIPAYEKWFTSRFTVASFENEMKWYSTEWKRNREDYSVPDAMLALAQRHGIKVRGHNVFWDTNNTQMAWVNPLSADELKAAMQKRLSSLVTRYAGKVIAWDVVNENLHGQFYESRLGPNVSAELYQQVAKIDTNATLFMNEYDTLEWALDVTAMASKYAAKMEQIRSYPGNDGIKLAVGLESHFETPNIPYMRATLDMLAQLKVPIWLTEVDVSPKTRPYQVEYLEDVLREGYGHPNVEGMVLWAAWHKHGCWVMCLTDNNFTNLPTGNVVDKLIDEWKTHPVAATTDAHGVAELDLVHGEYRFTVTHPSLESPMAHTLTVDASSSALEHAIDIKV